MRAFHPALPPALFRFLLKICRRFLRAILCVLRAVNGSEWRFAAYENEIKFFFEYAGGDTPRRQQRPIVRALIVAAYCCTKCRLMSVIKFTSGE